MASPSPSRTFAQRSFFTSQNIDWRRAPHTSHARAVCYVSTKDFLTKMMPKCDCATEGAGAVDQMTILAYSLVDITDGTVLSYTMVSVSQWTRLPLLSTSHRFQNPCTRRGAMRQRGLQRRAPAMALNGIMSQRMTSDLQVRRLAAVVGCIREVSSVPDDDGTVVGGVSTVLIVTHVSELSALESTSSPQPPVFRVADETREDFETKHWLLFLHEKLSLPAHVAHHTDLCALAFSLTARLLKWQG